MADPTRQDYDGYGVPEPGDDAIDRIMSAVDRAAAGERAPARRPARWRWPAAVVLAAVAAFAVAWLARGEGASGGARVAQNTGVAIYDVAGGTRFEVVTPAGTARALGTRFRVEVVDMKRSVKRGAIAATAIALVIVTVYEGRVLLGNDHGETVVRAGESARAASDEAPTAAAPTTPASEPTATAPAPREPRRFATPDERAALSRAIERARERRAASAAPSSAEAPPPEAPTLARPPVGVLDKDYIQERVRDVLPLLAECYTMALEDTPDLAGRVMTEFVISGEPDVGGLVEESTISDEGTTIAHPGMRECMRETLYSIEFEPPPNGGKVLVRYPFLFAPDGESDPGEAQNIDHIGDD